MPRITENARTPPTTSKKVAPDYGRPASTLPKFSVKKFWDADSTPPALAGLSRQVGAWAPKSGARTPQVEAGIAMASLMHDVAYYYGGSIADKQRADKLFGDQIPYFVGKLNPGAVEAAKATSLVDVAAVKAGGGVPFEESFSWSYGFEQSQRGFATLDGGENQKIDKISRDTFKQVVNQIANGTFKMSDVLKGKLAQASPAYQAEIKANMIKLAKELQQDLKSPAARKNIPGF